MVIAVFSFVDSVKQLNSRLNEPSAQNIPLLNLVDCFLMSNGITTSAKDIIFKRNGMQFPTFAYILGGIKYA